jgi:hypothetical protein
MALADTFKAIPDQFLDALGVTQQLILANTSAVVASARSFTAPVESLPFAEQLPDPVSASDNFFGFAEKVLASQRDFSHKLLEIYVPTRTPAPAKATAKSV